MTGRFIFYFTLVIFFSTGCGLRQRETVLQQKEAAFAEKEKQLQYREKSLELKEQELLLLKQQLDSSQANPHLVYNDSIVGTWNVKMTCTETTCPGSAIGDSKTETWVFTYQDKNILVKAMAGDKLVRIYTGSYDGKLVQLTEDVAHAGAAPGTRILVKLNLGDNNTMQGQRDIIRDNDCKILYKLQLNKQ